MLYSFLAEMYLNKKNNRFVITTTATIIFTLAITTTTTMLSVMMISAPVAQATTTAATTTTTTPRPEAAPSSSTLELSPQPIYQERSPPGNLIPINQTHAILSFFGSGMLTLPNTTQTMNTTHNSTGVISFITSYEIVQFNPAAPGGGKGIVTAVFQTNSTGMLAPLNGMIAVGVDDITSANESHVTLWRWESGIPLPTPPPTTSTTEESPPSSMNTTTMTNATTTADTNAATTAAPEEEVGAEGEEQQQPQQTTPTIPPPNPLFE
jgi:hypothetical protein